MLLSDDEKRKGCDVIDMLLHVQVCRPAGRGEQVLGVGVGRQVGITLRGDLVNGDFGLVLVLFDALEVIQVELSTIGPRVYVEGLT